jgi:hypothetical protein
MNAKRKFDFEQFLHGMQTRSFEKFYNKIRIPLDLAFTNKEFNYAGGYFYCANVSALGLGVEVGFNFSTIEKLPVELKRGYKTPFVKFYVTNPTGVAGAYVELHVGLYCPEFFEVIDNSDDPQTLAFLQTLADYTKAPYVEIRGQAAGYISQLKTTVGTTAVLIGAAISNTNVCERIIQAHPDNTDRIAIGKDNTVTVSDNLIKILEPGETLIISSLHKTAWYGISGTAGQTIYCGQTSITIAAF